MENKAELRKIFKQKRQSLKLPESDKIIINKIRELQIYQKSSHIMLFYPVQSEINLLDLLEDNKNFYFPKVEKENLLVCPYDGNFTKSVLNIPEPNTTPVNPEILDLIIVPALAVDKQGYRLGYGGGFYDRFLVKYPKIPTVVPVYKELFVGNLPHEKTDIKVKEVITN